MKSGLAFTLLVEYKDVFDDDPQTLDFYLNGISQSTLLSVASYFLGFSNTKSQFQDFTNFLSMFFRAKNNELANQINNKIKGLRRISGEGPVIINVVSNLQLFEYCFDNLTLEETQTEAEAEVNIFKAYLLLNTLNIKKEKNLKETTKNLGELKLAAFGLTQSFAYNEIQNFDIYENFTCQLIKSVFLFEFLETNNKTKLLFLEFLKHYDSNSGKDFITKLLPLVISSIQNTKEGYLDIVVDQDSNFEKNCAFLENLIVDNHNKDALTDIDFRYIRSNPFYKITIGTYRIIFKLFLIEKLFKALYFNLNEINNQLVDTPNLKNFRSFYCDEFSEKFLLYKVFKGIYNNRYIEFSGEEILKLGYQAEPDYYIRNGNYLFLIESKDILINADVKTSFDFGLLETEFKKKLYFENKKGKDVKKAVLQIVNNIERVLKKEFSFDKNYKERSINIYPILVLHDRQFNVVGLNVIINSWFKAEIAKLTEAGLPTNKVKPLVIIDIDTFILHQDLLKDKKIRLESILDKYYEFITFNKNKRYLNEEHMKYYAKRTILPFSYFLSIYLAHSGIFTTPKMLKDKAYSLLENSH
jgi:hypothetical protein